MKKLALCLFIFIFALIIFSPSLTARAEDNAEKKLEDEIEKGLDELITKELEDYFKGLNNDSKKNFGGSVREIINKIIKGEATDINAVYALLFDAVKSNLFSVTASLITIIILSLLFTLSKNLSSGFLKESTSQIIYYVIYGAIIAVLCALINSVILAARTVVHTIGTLVEISFPILLTVLTAIGGTASAAVYQPVTLIITKVVVNVIEYAVMPMFYATVVFTIMGNLTQNVKLDKLTKAIGSVSKWVLGVMFGLLITVVTAQGLVGASVDTVSIKSAKFALSSYVPILGGYLTEGFDIIFASAVLIKNALGLAAVIILFIAILAPVVKIIVTMLLMKLAAGIIEPMSDGRISNLLYSTSKNLSILAAIVLGMAFLAFLMFMLIIFTLNMGV